MITDMKMLIFIRNILYVLSVKTFLSINIFYNLYKYLILPYSALPYKLYNLYNKDYQIVKERQLSSTLDICAVCAWRVDCKKKFSISGRDIRCPDFSRDLTIKEETGKEDKEKQEEG